ncbi:MULTISPECIES: DUF2913 family protein [Vibrio]|uniref:DUF2913 family protein n=1 Tax=Vibrio TaxID=662 RepID=UPI0005FA47ED|nr:MULTISPECIES: DUF2913 family protein [Vibrio]KJY94311.1 alpha-acetolactate decarboxylase [Vibrio neptunius]MBN3571668.1 DUF2913 family protein [Vibrio neptunius]MDA0116632.1 DUF2913 family protein [Vibrio sp. T11.5]NRB66454.1 DUF2913 family protein [Vibrio sp.]QXX05456.1 DUF2913 family protein [Vibrio neptunius]
MSQYTAEIQNLVNSALEELAADHKSGKAADAPVANNHYLVRWVTRALKSQRFHRCVVDDLTRWQKAGRSKGNQAGLMPTFQRISKFYAEFFPQGEAERVITDSEINQFIDQMEESGWEISTSEPLLNCGKVQIFTEGPNSFALCTNQCDDCFDGERLIKPMSWFVRGNHAQFVEKASAAGFMLHKITDYKSNVKYHGEYLVYPGNQGNHLAEIPIGYPA